MSNLDRVYINKSNEKPKDSSTCTTFRISAKKITNKGAQNKKIAIADFEDKLKILKQKKEELINKRYNLSIEYTEIDRELYFFEVTGKFTQWLAKNLNDTCKQYDEQIKACTSDIKITQERINELEEKIATMKDTAK